MESKGKPGRRNALSDRLKGMRFMNRRDEATIREEFLVQQKEREREAHWTVEKTTGNEQYTGPLVILEEGISDNPMKGRLGRQSFGNFNPILERQTKVVKPNKSNEAPPSKAESAEMEDDNDSPQLVKLKPPMERKKPTRAIDGLRKVARSGIAKKDFQSRDRFRKNNKFSRPDRGRR